MLGAEWTLGDPDEGSALPRARMNDKNHERNEEHEHDTSTQRSTQLRGSRKVIIPLLLHLWCI